MAAISLTTSGSTYEEEFDSLAGTGTSSTLPPGWEIAETGTNANTTYTAGTGSSNGGDTYSFGSAAVPADRALGGLDSGSLLSRFGASFSNDTGATITSLLISYVGEQWRFGGSHTTIPERLNFQISFDATSLTTGTWTDIDQLDFVPPITSGGTGALDGNLAANRTAISFTIPGLTIAEGATFWIRWVGVDATSGDDGLAVDEFKLTPIAADVPGTFNIGDVAATEGDSGTTPIIFTVNRTGGSDGAVDVNYAVTFDSAAASDFEAGETFSGTLSFADGETSKTITLDILGDTDTESDETFTVTLSDPTGGASLGDATATGTITNDDAVVPVPGVLSIADASVTEGNSGTTAISFTVSRASGDDGAVGATWTATFVSADASDFAVAQTFTGTVNFADGDTSETITLDVAGDTAIEGDETFTVTLSAPTGGATLDDDTATGTITNDDAPPANVFINEIHYDDAGTDSGEAVEIAGTAGTNLSGWSLVFYNLTNGGAYATINLSGVIPDQDDGYGTLSFLAPGLQNGPQDGIALVNGVGTVVQFLSYEGTLTATDGPAIGMTSTDIGVSEEPAVADGFSLQLVGTGASYSDFTWAAAKANTFGAVNSSQDFLGTNATGLVSVRDTSVAEGDSGTTNLVFTVYRAGGLGQTASVDYAISLTGTADASDIGAGAVFSGTVTFNPGDSAVQVTVPIQGDTDGEANETLFITLSNPVGNITVTDASATGTIRNDDGVFAAIFEIQGASHTSPLVNQQVTTSGIVTAVDSNGYYLQDASGDGNDATSDGIFVFTSGAPTVIESGNPVPILVGDSLTVTGTVTEFQANAASLTVTELTGTTAVRNSSGNALPAAVVIGTGGRLPPTENYEDDNFTSFDPATDALDFYESMEGMRVTIQAPLVVANTNSFGETWVVASGGAGATGINARDGITVSEGDFNPERIQIDDDANLTPASYDPDHSQGDELADVTGILNYAFSSYEVVVTGPVTVTNDVTLGRETTALDGDPTHLTVASYNVENLDPTDPQSKFDAIAGQIVNNLSSPDIIGLQEIQDADGAGTGTNYSGQATADKLIAAIVAAGGPTYQYIEIAPTSNSTSNGEPNGNIRNGFLYNPERVTYVAGSAELVLGAVASGARYPLAADFIFNGETVTVINVHFTSRGGSDPLMGDNQPPSNAGDSARLTQAQAVRAYIDARAAAGDPELNIVTLGDFNSFYFEDPLEALQAGAAMTNLFDLLPEQERYTYMFEGNLQPLDNILVSPNLPRTSALDVVHLNAEQPASASKPTDHDPVLASILISADDIIIDSPGNDVRRSGDGNDFFYLNQGGDDTASGGTGNDVFFFGGAMTSADKVDGGAGTDQVALQGDYSGGLTFGVDVIDIENLAILPGNDTRFGDPGTNFYDYNITLLDVNVAAGVRMVIDANRLRVGEDFTFNGSAETDGSFFIYGGGGTDHLTGGANNDVFLFGAQGQWGASDVLVGGGGIDQLALRGDYTITFGAAQLVGIEQIAAVSAMDTRFGVLGDSYDYNLTMNDGNVVGIQMTVDAAPLRANETLTFNGAAEDDGSFRVFGGAGADVIGGSQNGDIIVGREGADMLTGNGGDDVYRYNATGDSTAAARDRISDFGSGDLVDLSRIDADILTAGDQAFSFIGTDAFNGVAGELRYQSNGGTEWLVQGDTDGNGIADFELILNIPVAHPITSADFIL